MFSAPRSRRAATSCPAYWPVPTTSTFWVLQSAMREAASSRASRTSERPAVPIAVCVFTSREVCEALWNSRSSREDVVPSARAPLERAAHLPRDLVLADDDRFESGRDGEEVLDRTLAGDDRDRAAQRIRFDPARLADGLDDGAVASPAASAAVVEVEVGLEAVAGGEHDGPRDPGVAGDEGGGGGCGADGELFEQVEAGVVVVRGEAQEHDLTLDT